LEQHCASSSFPGCTQTKEEEFLPPCIFSISLSLPTFPNPDITHGPLALPPSWKWQGSYTLRAALGRLHRSRFSHLTLSP